MRFSKLMLSVCALITMNGCAYIIPPEQNSPRHNTVLGGPRRPQMNLVSGPLSSLTRAPETNNFATAAPVVPVTTAAQQAPYAVGTPAAALAPEPQFQQPQPIAAMPAAAPAFEPARSTLLGIPMPSVSRTYASVVGTNETPAMPAAAPAFEPARTTLLGISMPSVSRTYASVVGANETPAMPAVEPAVKAQAERELAASAAPLAAAIAAADVSRRLPVENQQFQVAGNYPALDSVPPRPAFTGTDSSKSRLSATQADLERERTQALQSKETLARDAAAEPSLLSPMPAAQSTAPAPAAVTPSLPAATLPSTTPSAPAGNGAAITPPAAPVAVANATLAPRIVLPTTPITAAPLSVPTGPSFAPPAPLNMASLNVPQRQPVRMAPVDQPVAAQPVAAQPIMSAPAPQPAAAATNQRQPIMLRAPIPYEAEPPSPSASPAPARGGITVRPGDFDPLTGANNTPMHGQKTIAAQSTGTTTLADYATNRAIATSRYDTVRN